VDIEARARGHAALGDPIRLAIVDDLVVCDRSPGSLADRHRLGTNLLAHHLGVLEEAGLIARWTSSGDRRRRYVRLRHDVLPDLGFAWTVPAVPVVFICTHNSARSQLAAALWAREFGGEVTSAGTHPSDRVHPGAVEAGTRASLDLSGAIPRDLDGLDLGGAQVITVCDRAHEELEPGPSWWHWSTPDPANDPDPGSFDLALDRLRQRITTLHTEVRP
jgi:ArsR family transcriptional regulator, arsenate/arsenite/antimonite-responsive transcriptional repressor / arsenate reductase (thioredoxin)